MDRTWSSTFKDKVEEYLFLILIFHLIYNIVNKISLFHVDYQVLNPFQCQFMFVLSNK